MQLFVLALALGLFAAPELAAHQPGWAAHLTGVQLALLVLAPKLALAAVYGFACFFTLRRLSTRGGRGAFGGHVALRWLDRFNWVFRYLAIKLYFLDLYAGLWGTLDAALGRPILVTDVLTILPSLGLVVAAWWSYYPIDRRLREATLIGRLDAGEPVHAIWTRGQYILSQLRHQVALVLAPLLVLRAWEQTLRSERLLALLPERAAAAVGFARPALFLAGVAGVFLFAPVMIRRLWDTAPLPAGELRDRLLALCRQHRVRVRELLLWRTYGGMINAAVMGVAGPVRYILLTDALLESLPTRQIEAVMAHEVAHVRRHHMLWLVAAAAGGWIALVIGWLQAMAMVHAAAPVRASGWLIQLGVTPEQRVEAAAYVGAVACWVLLFGWVSRRFERQADTFAVQHLASMRAASLSPSPLAGEGRGERGRLGLLGAPKSEDDAPLGGVRTGEFQHPADECDLVPSAPPSPTRGEGVRPLPAPAPLAVPALFPGAFLASGTSSPLPHNPDASPVIDALSVHAMTDALQQVADLNHIPVSKRSWRHGSIAWRQDYLRTLVGRPVAGLPIDRHVFWIKVATAIAVAVAIAALLAQPDLANQL